MSIVTVVRGFSKVFVGEIVEKGELGARAELLTYLLITTIDSLARSVAQHDGSLTPNDLREAYRLYQAEHKAGSGGVARKKLFVK